MQQCRITMGAIVGQGTRTQKIYQMNQNLVERFEIILSWKLWTINNGFH